MLGKRKEDPQVVSMREQLRTAKTKIADLETQAENDNRRKSMLEEEVEKLKKEIASLKKPVSHDLILSDRATHVIKLMVDHGQSMFPDWMRQNEGWTYNVIYATFLELQDHKLIEVETESKHPETVVYKLTESGLRIGTADATANPKIKNHADIADYAKRQQDEILRQMMPKREDG